MLPQNVQPGTLVVATHLKGGRTMLALSIANHLNQVAAARVLFYSAANNTADLFERLLASRTSVMSAAIRLRSLTVAERAKLEAVSLQGFDLTESVSPELVKAAYDVVVLDDAELMPLELCQELQAIARERGLYLILTLPLTYEGRLRLGPVQLDPATVVWTWSLGEEALAANQITVKQRVKDETTSFNLKLDLDYARITDV